VSPPRNPKCRRSLVLLGQGPRTLSHNGNLFIIFLCYGRDQGFFPFCEPPALKLFSSFKTGDFKAKCLPNEKPYFSPLLRHPYDAVPSIRACVEQNRLNPAPLLHPLRYSSIPPPRFPPGGNPTASERHAEFPPHETKQIMFTCVLL